MGDKGNMTVSFQSVQAQEDNQVKKLLREVVLALVEKGYNPVNQLVGYLVSGDPAYITGHKNARNLIQRLERDEIIEELVNSYLKGIV
ncbi:MAG TPA: IreB family regulatory phosphoprotein [Bacillota bacterium]|nr:IreB family regulatory phosphoprotein [Bacillota bacterium]HOG53465.1 IreB family regulatory phosphoprotein [Bacillota bacterium]